ncbi:hypothetical protein F5X98DRAFT_331536 [Xylaria grammica]|nr:hypothetical protein F5X98DRAFT_331536 [Xylaria grammica]
MQKAAAGAMMVRGVILPLGAILRIKWSFALGGRVIRCLLTTEGSQAREKRKVRASASVLTIFYIIIGEYYVESTMRLCC